MHDTGNAASGPLAFKLREVPPATIAAGPAANALYRVDARHVGGHLREAVVSAGSGNAWRMLSDEGLHLKGTDLAPFPFGYFNAGLQADLMRCLRDTAAARGIAIDALDLALDNEYWLTGSFALGTAQGFAAPTQIEVAVNSAAPAAAIQSLADAAVESSPALDLLRTPHTNTFALYINGRRYRVEDVPASPAADALDPFLRYRAPPQAAPDSAIVVEKTAAREDGAISIAPSATTTRITRRVTGRGHLDAASGMTEIESWLQLPGMSHFRFRSDESGAENIGARAPSGLALLSAGLAFCFMTQLARYVEAMKLEVGAIRLVQFSPYSTGATGAAGAVDTHLFLDGAAAADVQTRLLTMAARTCYLHAAIAAALPPVLRVRHNGNAL